MKKVRIPFSLDEYNKGGYSVETRGDENNEPQKSRILCTDRKYKNYPILALILDENENIEKTAWYRLNGMYSYMCETYLDLVLVKQEFEDGDIITTHGDVINFIIPYRGTDNNGGVLTEVYCDRADLKINTHPNATRGCGFTKYYCLATEDEKKIFFDALEKVGKRWNAETKQVEDITHKCALRPFDKVLVRNSNYHCWVCQLFGYKTNCTKYPFMCMSSDYDQCIPYNDETKHLLGTIDDAPEKYKTW